MNIGGVACEYWRCGFWIGCSETEPAKPNGKVMNQV